MASGSFPKWFCKTCGKEERGTAHQLRKTYCSKDCMARDYSARMSGDSNPNRRPGCKTKICCGCGGEFHHYSKQRKFCSRECYWASRVKPGKRHRKPSPHKCKQSGCVQCGASLAGTRQMKYCGAECRDAFIAANKPKREPRPRKRVRHTSTCRNCGERFASSPSHKRKFCTYDCFLDSGGSVRAGNAAAKMTRKYGVKKDANHDEIMEILSAEVFTRDMSRCGFGVPDGIAWIRGGWRLFDIKNPDTSYGRKGLNDNQKAWIDGWPSGPVFLLYNERDARNLLDGNFDEVQYYPEDAEVEDYGDGPPIVYQVSSIEDVDRFFNRDALIDDSGYEGQP